MQTFQNYLIYWCSRKRRFLLFYISLFTQEIFWRIEYKMQKNWVSSYSLVQVFCCCSCLKIYVTCGQFESRFAKTANIDFYWEPQWLEWSESIKMDSSCSFTLYIIAELNDVTHDNSDHCVAGLSVRRAARGLCGQRDGRRRGVPRLWAQANGDNLKAVEHHRDPERPLPGELDRDGQRGDHQVPERDDSVHQGGDQGDGGQESPELQQGKHNRKECRRFLLLDCCL